ncbi:MAG TPA: Flp pilus assembly protein CpaB [Candidatus Limnocylindrales bacterium]
MKRSNRLILLIGVFLAIVAFIGIVFVFNGQQTSQQQQQQTTATEVVAARDIPLGNAIVKDDLTTKSVNIADKPADAFGDTSLVLGQIARADIKAGQVITRSNAFASAGGTNSLQVVSSLAKGQRAVAVQVDQVTGVGTIVQTGDRVDVVIGVRIQQLLPDPKNPGNYTDFPGGPQLSVKTVIQNLKVVGTLLPPPSAAQQQAQQQQAQASPAAGGTSTTGPTTTLNGQQEIVILSVTPQQAEVLRYAQLGAEPITLTLRSTEDKDSPPDATTGVVLKTLIDQYGVIPPFPPIASAPR